MFTNLKRVFNSINGGHSLKGLEEKSKSVLEIFDRTVIELKEVNESILKERDAKQQLIEEALFEVESLNSLHSKHNRIISKINDILS